MSLPPKKLREVVFQILYCYDMGFSEAESIVDLLVKELEISKKNVRMGEERARKVLAHLSAIDQLITQTSLSYDFNRIQRVERNILRLSVFEMLYDDEIDAKVAIAEAIRLARKFSTPESANFINAILDAIYKQSLGNAVDESLISQAAKSLKESEETAKEAHKYLHEDPQED